MGSWSGVLQWGLVVGLVVDLMADYFEVYDNEQVQLVTRRQATFTFVVLAGAIAGSLLLIVLTREAVVPFWAGLSLTLIVWGVAAYRLAHHFSRTNHVVWCVKISVAQVAGYDYARRQTSLFWTDVREVDLCDQGLRIRGVTDKHIEIPHLFPDFPSLSHRIVEHAERHHVPIFVDGRPFEDLDLYALYPFLSSAESQPGSR